MKSAFHQHVCCLGIVFVLRLASHCERNKATGCIEPRAARSITSLRIRLVALHWCVLGHLHAPQLCVIPNCAACGKRVSGGFHPWRSRACCCSTVLDDPAAHE